MYVANGAVGNFFEYAAENSDSGLFKPDIQGMIIYGGRYNEGIWNVCSGRRGMRREEAGDGGGGNRGANSMLRSTEVRAWTS